MLSDTSCNDDIVLSNRLGLLVQLPHDLLRFELLSLLRRGESEWIPLLHLPTPLHPCCPLVGLNLRDKLGQRGSDVSQNRHIGLDDLVDVLGLNFKVDDTTSTL